MLIQCSSISVATLALRRAAVTYNRGPKGMKAWQLLLDWLMPAERAGLSLAAVGFCREALWVRTVATDARFLPMGGVIPDCSSSLHARFFPMAPETYKSLPFRLFFLGGASCPAHHHYITTKTRVWPYLYHQGILPYAHSLYDYTLFTWGWGFLGFSHLPVPFRSLDAEAEEVSAIFRGVASQRGSVATYVGAVEGTTSWARGDTLNTLKSVSTTI